MYVYIFVCVYTNTHTNLPSSQDTYESVMSHTHTGIRNHGKKIA